MKHRLQEEHPCKPIAATNGKQATGSSSTKLPPIPARPGPAAAPVQARRAGSAASSTATAAQLSEDERLARELQEQEDLQAALAGSAAASQRGSSQAAPGRGSGNPKKKLSQRIASMFACFSKPRTS